ncbi:hypothetical protein ACGFX4_37710 [Kitasatospora sp. NPDC048365]|uniref:hypothetical protein n=1 Tax=Kitasatospora sp. NPDC048365 TaxID=3364050 RepID=UPI003712422C
MIEILAGVLACALTGWWLATRRARRTAAARAAGLRVDISCAVRPRDGGSWRRGRLTAGGPVATWQPASGRVQPVQLPAQTTPPVVRSASAREWMALNPSCRIVECDSPAVSVAVLPQDLDALLAVLSPA